MFIKLYSEADYQSFSSALQDSRTAYQEIVMKETSQVIIRANNFGVFILSKALSQLRHLRRKLDNKRLLKTFFNFQFPTPTRIP
jgi:hypothetical protein